LKQHLANRGSEVVRCRHVPPDVREYFQRDLDRAKNATNDRARERLLREEAAGRGNNGGEADDEDAQVRHAMELTRAEEEYRQRVEWRGGAYKRGGGGSGSSGLNPL
jgi:hypothetical protein